MFPDPDRVNERELQNALADRLHDWKLSGKAIERTFVFPDFKTALEFVNRLGDKAEDVQHHPDIDIRYNKVKLTLTSHDAGEITRRDLMLAGYANEFAPEYENRKTA